MLVSHQLFHRGQIHSRHNESTSEGMPLIMKCKIDNPASCAGSSTCFHHLTVLKHRLHWIAIAMHLKLLQRGCQRFVPGDVACFVSLGVCGFNVLGYTFRPRRSQNRGGTVSNFSPAVADKACKAMRAEIRDWKLHLRSGKSIEDLSRMFNSEIRGWLHRFA
jgi:hypothetical protein